MYLRGLFTAVVMTCASGAALAQDTAAVQSALSILGYDAGPADGVWGGKTRTALQAFYADTGGQFSGRLGRDDHTALLGALRQRIEAEAEADSEKASPIYPSLDFSPGIEVWFPSQYAFADGASRPARRDFPFAVIQPYVHDFDGDSCDDILVQFMDSHAHPYLIRGGSEAGEGDFVAELAEYIPKSRSIRNAALRDIDGNGSADFVGFTAPHGLEGRGYVPRPDPEIVIPQGGDAWATTHSTYSHGGLVGDVNGDGIVDIFPIEEDGTKPRHAILGDGKGGFSERFRVTALSGDFIFDAQSADLNGDGVDDFVAITSLDYSRAGAVPPSRAGENGTLAIALGEPGKSINELEFVRLGTHAMDDLHWTAYRLQAAYGEAGDVGYSGSGVYSAPSNVDLIDFDGDGDLDILVGYFVSTNSSWKTSGFRLFRNDNGQFSDVTDEVAPHQPANLFHGDQQPGEISNQATDAMIGASMIDMNADGQKDLLLSIQTPDVMHHDDYRATVYVSTNGRLLPAAASDDDFRYTAHMVAGDFNCDGKDDVAGAGFNNESEHSIRIMLGVN